jgi:hypothetical protein
LGNLQVQEVRKQGIEISVEITEKELESPMDGEAMNRALILLAQWALRKAQEQVKTGRESLITIVTFDFSKNYTNRKTNN